jgi:hypothetical protein
MTLLECSFRLSMPLVRADLNRFMDFLEKLSEQT